MTQTIETPFLNIHFFVYCKNKLVPRYNDMCSVNEKN